MTAFEEELALGFLLLYTVVLLPCEDECQASKFESLRDYQSFDLRRHMAGKGLAEDDSHRNMLQLQNRSQQEENVSCSRGFRESRVTNGVSCGLRNAWMGQCWETQICNIDTYRRIKQPYRWLVAMLD